MKQFSETSLVLGDRSTNVNGYVDNWTVEKAVNETGRSRNLKEDDSMTQTMGSDFTLLIYQSRRSQGMKGPFTLAG